VTLNRKEFLTRGLLEFGRELVLRVSAAGHPAAEPAGERQGMLLVDNSRCLAQRGGCFACMDHCPREALTILLGAGIAVDPEKCDGCGKCIERCPVEPKVLALACPVSGTAARQPEKIPQ
jgi:ferredoxin